MVEKYFQACAKMSIQQNDHLITPQWRNEGLIVYEVCTVLYTLHTQFISSHGRPYCFGWKCSAPTIMVNYRLHKDTKHCKFIGQPQHARCQGKGCVNAHILKIEHEWLRKILEFV